MKVNSTIVGIYGSESYEDLVAVNEVITHCLSDDYVIVSEGHPGPERYAGLLLKARWAEDRVCSGGHLVAYPDQWMDIINIIFWNYTDDNIRTFIKNSQYRGDFGYVIADDMCTNFPRVQRIEDVDVDKFYD
jgi:hypothetical protein